MLNTVKLTTVCYPGHRQWTWFTLLGVFGLALALIANDAAAEEKKPSGALLETPLPYLSDGQIPERTPPIIEIGPRFLGTGAIDEGFELPTGAVWQPALWVFGDYRSALSYVANNDAGDLGEWANSLDIFTNLQLSGTERILLGLDPIQFNGASSGHRWRPSGSDQGWQNEFNSRISTLFFEGELGEIFPRLDPEDRSAYDLGFSIGRQPIFFQEGVMLNDTIDAIAINRDTLQFPYVVDSRLTFLYGWNQVNRDDNVEDEDAQIFGLFSETDFRASTVNLDLAYVKSGDDRIGQAGGRGDGFYAGLAATQRIGQINTSFRINGSFALDTPNAAIDDGVLLMAETSFAPLKSHDVVYFNAFAGIDHYSSASRGASTGGPLGQVGILFASLGTGSVGAPISNRADEVVGSAIGYQMFFDDDRRQIIFEVAGRLGSETTVSDQGGIGARFQQAVGRRSVLQLDGFAIAKENQSDVLGMRSEWILRF